MLVIGIVISDKINDSLMEQYQKYNTALQINDDPELFKYGMRTNVGNAFVHGDLVAVDPVSYPEVDGLYGSMTKVTERYTMHTRTVTKTRTVNGKTQTYTEVETYWTWDRVDSEDKKCQEISFCGITFNSNKIDLPSTDYIDTIKESSHIRYKYYGVGTNYIGTIFTDLRDKTISDNTKFYKDKNIEETVKQLESGGGAIIFWIFWIVLICGCVFGFYYAENKWLE